jgi:hypothetical protein
VLTSGAAVCLVDVCATGETAVGRDRGRRSAATSHAATALMLGESTLGVQLADLRLCLRWLRADERFDPERIALWGESLAPVNPPDRVWRVPHDAEALAGQKLPENSEPLGALAVLLAGLFEDNVSAIHTSGGLSSWQSALASPFICMPYDVVVPGALTCGDWQDLVALQTAPAVRITGAVDAANRRVEQVELDKSYAAARRELGKRLELVAESTSAGMTASWLIERLK